MTDGDESSRSNPDILIAGAGLAGLTAAYGMARAGFDVACCGAAERTGRGRTVALLSQSVAFLEVQLGLWADLEARAAPLRSLRLIDDSGAFFPPRPVEFHAAEIGLDAFGWISKTTLWPRRSWPRSARFVGLERVAMGVEAYEFCADAVRARLGDGREIVARLAIGADGRDSKARRAGGLTARIHRYPQTALTAHLAHRLPHDDFSTEFHTRGGPLPWFPCPPQRPRLTDRAWSG